MATNSKIEWTHHTANLWWGCTKVHAGCDNCYALAFSKRVGNDIWGNDKPRRMIKDVWKNLEKFQKEAEKSGEIHRVFVGSMMDIFEKPMTLVDHNGNQYPIAESEFWNTGQLRDKFFNEVVPNSPNLLFLLLTKRPSNINKYIPDSWKENPPKNVFFGTSPVNQETANNLIVQLSKVNGLRFLSIEPQLEKIDLMVKANDGTDRVLLDLVDWIINGGESGHHKRPFDCDWARLIRDDCKVKGVPFFFKQIDKIQTIPEDLMIREFPKNNNKLNNLKQLKMKTLKENTKSKEERILNNNNKCAVAIAKGYKYDRATGEIIGQRKKVIKAQINGYTIISFVVDGVKQYLYGTTLIEYILKNENESISQEEIELAKAYAKPSTAYLAKRKALRQAKAKEAFVETKLAEILSNGLQSSLLSNDYPTKKKSLDKGFINSEYQIRPNTYSNNNINNTL